jgi:hypothetical protein
LNPCFNQTTRDVFVSVASLQIFYMSPLMIFAARLSGLQGELWWNDSALHIQKTTMLPEGNNKS